MLNPATKAGLQHQSNRLFVEVCRMFRGEASKEEEEGKERGRGDRSDKVQPRVRAEDIAQQFPLLTEAFIKKRLKPCAELQVSWLPCLGT